MLRDDNNTQEEIMRESFISNPSHPVGDAAAAAAADDSANERRTVKTNGKGIMLQGELPACCGICCLLLCLLLVLIPLVFMTYYFVKLSMDISNALAVTAESQQYVEFEFMATPDVNTDMYQRLIQYGTESNYTCQMTYGDSVTCNNEDASLIVIYYTDGGPIFVPSDESHGDGGIKTREDIVAFLEANHPRGGPRVEKFSSTKALKVHQKKESKFRIDIQN